MFGNKYLMSEWSLLKRRFNPMLSSLAGKSGLMLVCGYYWGAQDHGKEYRHIDTHKLFPEAV